MFYLTWAYRFRDLLKINLKHNFKDLINYFFNLFKNFFLFSAQKAIEIIITSEIENNLPYIPFLNSSAARRAMRSLTGSNFFGLAVTVGSALRNTFLCD